MSEKKELNLDVYNIYDALFPLEYFEIYIQREGEKTWRIFYVDKEGEEKEFGPLSEPELLKTVTASPFLFEEIVFVYYLIEHKDEELKALGVRLLKLIANT